jgi:hypothetical protein
MVFMAIYKSSQTGPGVKPFGRKNDGLKVRRLLFDRKLVMHGANTIAEIVYEIKKATKPISLQRASTVPVEKKFGEIRMHAGVRQAMVELVKTMEADEAMQFIYVQDQIKNWRLAYGETVFPCSCLTGIGITPLISVEAIIHILEFPAVISPPLGHLQLDEFHLLAEKLMSDALLSFTKTNFYMMRTRKRRSLYQELHGVTPSSRRIVLSSKSEIRRMVGRTAANPIEQHLGALLGRPRIASEDLKMLIQYFATP